MIDNEMNNRLNRHFNRSAQAENSDSLAGTAKKLNARNNALQGRTASEEATEKDAAEAAAKKPALRDMVNLSLNKTGPFAAGNGKKSFPGNPPGAGYRKNRQTKAESETEAGEPTPEERRQKELKTILDKINSEEEAKYPARSSANAATSVLSPEMADSLAASSGLSGFLNDMPLFDEFKTGLMDAFKLMDKGSLGSVSAQYELNYSSVQYIANAAGGYEYKETSLNFKLDLSYIKASAGNGGGQAMADLIGQSTDFASLIETLNGAASSQPAATPKDFLAQMEDYFSPEKTAGRIVDFATAFFPNSAAFKAGGDTEEARSEFAETMRAAIQKGFDQAMGVLGKTPKAVQDDIDKTHERTFKGLDDFVKNGLSKEKEAEGLYASLERWNLSINLSYSEKTVSAAAGAYAPVGQAGSGGLNLQA